MSGLITRNGDARIDTGRRDYRRVSAGLLCWREIRRAVRLFVLRGELACIKSERENYSRACNRGVRLGENYLANSEREQRRIEGRIAFVESRLDY